MKLNPEERKRLAHLIEVLECEYYYSKTRLGRIFNVTRQTIGRWSKGRGNKRTLQQCEDKLKEIKQ